MVNRNGPQDSHVVSVASDLKTNRLETLLVKWSFYSLEELDRDVGSDCRKFFETFDRVVVNSPDWINVNLSGSRVVVNPRGRNSQSERNFLPVTIL